MFVSVFRKAAEVLRKFNETGDKSFLTSIFSQVYKFLPEMRGFFLIQHTKTGKKHSK
jgi:hypothetical protein